MHSRDLLRTAGKGLVTNITQSMLTMTGIVIGVCAVVLMTGIGKSMEGVILGQVSMLGPRSIALWPGSQGPEGGAASLRSDFDSLKHSDIEALSSLETIESVAPMIMVTGTAKAGREQMDPRIVGSKPAYYGNQNIELAEGSFHTDSDERSARSVAVIGSDIVKDLFPTENPIGRRIQIAGRTFTVVGVLSPVGTQFLQNIDDRIVIPFSVARAMTGKPFVDMVTMQAREGVPIQLAAEEVRLLMRQRHSITSPPGDPTENDDFLVRTAEQAREILGAVSMGLSVFITMVAGISLLVGGIGIMNIMLVTVTQRTREIGLRKAVGAKRQDILKQFLFESSALTLLGGLLGALLGVGLSLIAASIVSRLLDDYLFAISWNAIAITLLSATVTGLIFGIYPARKASRLSPINAIRYE